MERMRKKDEREINSGLESFTADFVVRKIGVEKILELSPMGIRRYVNKILGEAPRQYVEDLERHGFFDDGINKDGIEFIRNIAQRHV